MPDNVDLAPRTSVPLTLCRLFKWCPLSSKNTTLFRRRLVFLGPNYLNKGVSFSIGRLKASHNYIVCASLLSGDGTQEVDQVIVPPKSGSRLVDPYLRNLESDGFGPSHVKVLVGTLVSSAQIYEDLTKETGLFFIFHDLSIRTLGEFRLKVRLICHAPRRIPQ